MIANRSEPSPKGRLPAGPDAFHPLLDNPSEQSTGGPTLGSGVSRILIVDDNPDILNLVARMATRLGYHPTVAEDGVDALYYLTKGYYDLVITDYDMPFIDGYQLADQIKEKYFGTKVIIMTGHSESDVADLLDGSGIVDGLLLKPFNLKALKEKIDMAVQPRFRTWTS
jgi:CheY-like chemotaxis protein